MIWVTALSGIAFASALSLTIYLVGRKFNDEE